MVRHCTTSWRKDLRRAKTPSVRDPVSVFLTRSYIPYLSCATLSFIPFGYYPPHSLSRIYVRSLVRFPSSSSLMLPSYGGTCALVSRLFSNSRIRSGYTGQEPTRPIGLRVSFSAQRD